MREKNQWYYKDNKFYKNPFIDERYLNNLVGPFTTRQKARDHRMENMLEQYDTQLKDFPTGGEVTPAQELTDIPLQDMLDDYKPSKYIAESNAFHSEPKQLNFLQRLIKKLRNK